VRRPPGVENVEQAGHGVHDLLDPVLPPAQSGDVVQGADDVQITLHIDRSEADLHPDLASVATNGDQLAARSHAACRRLRGKLDPMLRVSRSQALGNEDLHRLPDELLPPVAEHRHGRFVDERDPAGPVHDHNRLGNRLESGSSQTRVLSCRHVDDSLLESWRGTQQSSARSGSRPLSSPVTDVCQFKPLARNQP